MDPQDEQWKVARDRIYRFLSDPATPKDDPRRKQLAALLESGRGTAPIPAPGEHASLQMRPPVGHEDPSGVVQDLDARPGFDPTGQSRRVQREIRGAPPGEPLAAAQARGQEGLDPLNGGDIDPTTMAVLSNVAAAGAGQIARGLPVIRGLMQGGAGARTLGGAAVGATEGATATGMSGGSTGDVVSGALLGGALRGAGSAAGGIRSPTTRTGQAIARVNAVGGRPAVTRPAAGGMFDEPGYRELPEGAPGTARMAGQAEEEIAGSLDARDVAKNDALHVVEDRVQARRGTEPLPSTAGRQEIAGIREASRGGAGPISAENDAILARADSHFRGDATRANLPPQPSPDRSYYYGGEPTVPEANANTFQELRNLHRNLNQEAKIAVEARDPSAGARQQAAGVARRMVRSADPEMEPTLDSFAAEQDALRRSNDILYGADAPIPPTRAGKQIVGSKRLANAGSEIDNSLAYENQLDELQGLDPAAGRQVPRMRARNAAENVLRFGLPEQGAFGGVTNYALRALRKNAGAASARVGAPLSDAAARAADAARVGMSSGARLISPTDMMRRKKKEREEQQR